MQCSGHPPQGNIQPKMLLVLRLGTLIGPSCLCCCDSAHPYYTKQCECMCIFLYWDRTQGLWQGKQVLYHWVLVSASCTCIFKIGIHYVVLLSLNSWSSCLCFSSTSKGQYAKQKKNFDVMNETQGMYLPGMCSSTDLLTLSSDTYIFNVPK
jgi:hypothetical protein